MKKIFIFSLLLLAGLSAKAQDFKVIDYTKGYEVEHKPDKSQKVNIMKPAIALTFFDFDRDGKQDTILYKRSMSGGETAIFRVFDSKADDWVTLLKFNLLKFGGEDGMWFYQLNEAPGAPPRLLIYVKTTTNKFLQMITYDQVTKKYISKEYKLNPKNLFPHKYVVNKKKVWSHSGANSEERDAYEEIEVNP